jgi:hypothetical protein
MSAIAPWGDTSETGGLLDVLSFPGGDVRIRLLTVQNKSLLHHQGVIASSL